VFKVPSEKSFERMAMGDTCCSVAGCGPIEPDGHDEHGYPSWLLVMGFI
jgi:hypothetical protein